MRAIFPFVLLAVAATLPACTCASSEPGAASAGAPADSAAGSTDSAAGAPAARLVRGRQPAVKVNPNLNLRNIRTSPTTVPPAASTP